VRKANTTECAGRCRFRPLGIAAGVVFAFFLRVPVTTGVFPFSMKYIFVTGGVVSSLGKGLAAASLGTLLEHRGLKVVLQKFDPYLNVDPGTMNPFQHGEVYVLDDGAETDLDLGHYERFTNCVLTRTNSTTSGQIYETVLAKERRGDYLGKTVQVIPHVTDEIKSRLRQLGTEQPCDVLITEIGGTTGDIEGLPFLEAIRQFVLEVGPQNVVIMHVTLVPYIKAAGELKTKPSQQSIAKLREIGLHPQVLVCRTEHPLELEVRQKLSMFCNVPLDAVVEARDVEHSIYEMPLMLQRERLDETVCKLLGLTPPPAKMDDWSRFVDRVVKPKKRVKIAVVGKYIELQDAYKSIYESLTHAAASADCGIDLVRVDAEEVEDIEPAKLLRDVAGILVPGGFGDRGVEGKVRATQFARENQVPFLGLCLGMQVATIEFARNVCGLEGANSTEFETNAKHPVICLLPEQRDVTEKGASMRLGTWPTCIREGTRAHQVYGKTEIIERHRHRYEFNMDYREQMEGKGFVISGTSPEGRLVELVELKDHPWFLACQYHPEFRSKPNKPHPLFKGFVTACLAHGS
jgi:CTP synthase